MKECIILAGGFGTRLKSVVKDLPKCMAQVAGRPFLYYILTYLERQNMDRVILSLGYKSEAVTKWLESTHFSLDVVSVTEKEPLGTGGAIRFAASKVIGDTFFVINGDTYFNVDLDEMYKFHLEKKSDISVALLHMSDFDRYGSVIIDENDKITGFREKQFCWSAFINGGIYVVNKKLFEDYSFEQKFSFEKDVLENKSSVLNIFGFKQEKYFIDIGIPSDFEKANKEFIGFKK